MAEQCKGVETGRTSLATIRNVREKNHILSADFPDGETWTGGVRLAGDLWFWYKENGKGKILTDISPTFWGEGRPSETKKDGSGGGSCIAFYNSVGNGTWTNASCDDKKPSLCELRC